MSDAVSDDLRRIFDELGAVHVSVQKSDESYLVNFRLPDRGWTCAQSRHATIEDALAEHLDTAVHTDDGLLDL